MISQNDEENITNKLSYFYLESSRLEVLCEILCTYLENYQDEQPLAYKSLYLTTIIKDDLEKLSTEIDILLSEELHKKIPTVD